jgi:predicted transcriptional regulator of viral defense system
MTKTEDLYRTLLEKKVVTSQDVQNAVKGRSAGNMNKVYGIYIRRLLQARKLLRIRRGLYAALGPLEKPSDFVPDRFLVASKVRPRGYLGFHTALEFHGAAHSAHNNVYVVVGRQDKLRPFPFRGTNYLAVLSERPATGVVTVEYAGSMLRVSSKERTFMDCIDRPEYAGGWEECLLSLEAMGGVDVDKLRALLIESGRDLLLRKAGLVLETLSRASAYYAGVSQTILRKIQYRTGSAPMYLDPIRPPSTLNARWKLYVPDDFQNILGGPA